MVRIVGVGQDLTDAERPARAAVAQPRHVRLQPIGICRQKLADQLGFLAEPLERGVAAGQRLRPPWRLCRRRAKHEGVVHETEVLDAVGNQVQVT